MKKVPIMLLAALMLFAFAACDDKTPEPEDTVLYENNFDGADAAASTAFLGEGTKRTVENGALKVESGKGFGLFINKKIGTFDELTGSVGDTYRLEFDVNADSLEAGKFAVGACMGDEAGHANYVNEYFEADDLTSVDAFTVEFTYTSNDAFTVKVNGGEAHDMTIAHDGDTPAESWINFTGWVDTGSVLVDNIRLVKVAD